MLRGKSNRVSSPVSARFSISGPPGKLAESLNEYAGMGVSHIQIRFRNRSLQELLDQMDTFAAEVAPLLRGP